MQAGAHVDIEAGLLTTSYEQNGEEIDPGSMVQEVKKDPDAAVHVKRSRAWGIGAIVVAGVGGGLVGWSLGYAIEGDPNWALIAVGGGAIAASIPLMVVSNSQLRKGVERYNDNLGEPDTAVESKLSNLRLVVAPAPGGPTVGLAADF
jgi:hypothetical protein